MRGQANATVDDDPTGRQQRRFRHFLLDRRFQLKYTGMVLGMASAVSLVLGLFLIEKVRENSRMLQLEAAFDEAFQAQLAAADAKVVAVLILAFVSFLVVLALMSVLITHRMVGPIFVMRRYIREIGAGGLPRVRSLRRGDEFTDLFDTLVEALGAMERRALDEIGTLERAKAALPAGHASHEELDTLIAKKRTMLPKSGGSEPPPAQ
ncbi:MAG: hypothetical protein IT384_29950 [Deltaproteobacteria bacterium]|nr:hypothetical protein [Deltaproteobacteria bacterium]